MVRAPYPVAIRLCQIAADRWPQIDAKYYQIDMLRLRPTRFANLVYAYAIELVPSDDLDEWHTKLFDPLPWMDVADSEYAAELESESFFNMQGKGG